MQHWRVVLRESARPWAGLLAVVLTACGGEAGELVVIVHSTRGTGALEALALPADPAPLARRPRGPAAGSGDARRWESARDSAADAGTRFARLRDSLVAEARALEALDRRTPVYAARFDAYRRRAQEAATVRAVRDRTRRRADALAPRGATAAVNPAAPAGERAALEALRDGERRPVRAPVAAGAARLRLTHGTWWVGVAPPGTAPARYTRVTIAANGRDTIAVTR
jgi:hypothetical protein